MLFTSRDTSRISIRSRSPCPRSRPSSIGASGSSQRSQSRCADGQRHPVVDLGERAGGVGGDDRAAQQRRGVLRGIFGPPRRPQPRHEQRLAVAAVHVERRLAGLLACAVLAATRTSRPSAPGSACSSPNCGTPASGDLLGAGVDQQRALGVGPPSSVALAHGGTRPQRIDRTRRVDSSSGSVWRLTTVRSSSSARRCSSPWPRGAPSGRRRGLVDRLDLLGQQRRIGGHRESPAHISMVAPAADAP